MFDAGVESPLGDLLGSVRSVVAGVDVGALEVAEAARVVEECAEMEKRLAALRVAAAATLQDKAFWRREGFRSAAHWMAAKTGAAVGTAIATMEMAGLLADLPVVAEAFRNGLLSEAQAREIAAVAADVPDAEERLVEAAGKLSLRGLQEECRRVEAAACTNEDERYRRVHRSRSYRTWVDRHGVGHVSARLTPDELARLNNEIERRYSAMIEEAIRGGWFEGRDAHLADALVDLARPNSAGRHGPETMVHVMVDYEALMRGHTVTGEKCEIPGIGPIPVTLARQMADDAILKILLTKGVNVMAVAHAGYTIPARVRTALEARDPKCIVPRCDRRRDLQNDHRNAYGRTRVTKLEDLGRLCRWHHYMKTFLGYTYRGGPGTWEWLPPADRDIDLTPLRKIITSARGAEGSPSPGGESGGFRPLLFFSGRCDDNGVGPRPRSKALKVRAILPAAVVVSLTLAPLPVAATHKCGTEEPRCVDQRTLVQKPDRQEVVSRVLGHHCYHDTDAGQPNQDRRVLLSRIGVVFSNVTRKSGHLEEVMIYFEGEERQIMGSVDAFGRRNDFHRYNDEERSPGSKISFRVGKNVEFNTLKGRKDAGVYNIQNEPAARRPGASGPGGNPGGPARPGLSVECKGLHHLILEVIPPSPPPCRNKPPEPCPPG